MTRIYDHMRHLLKNVLPIFLLVCAVQAQAALNVFACEPEWAALAQEIGGDAVSVYSATTALQDPHHIQARPSLIARARQADLLICTGAELESGWLPQVLQQAGNRRIQPGTPGYFEAAQYVPKLGIPSRLDRADGDVHASGNPHIQLDPRNIARVADALTGRMAALDPSRADIYGQRHADFRKRWEDASARWDVQAAKLRGMPILTHHDNMLYLANWLALQQIGTLEPRPGIPPTAAHLQALLATLQKSPARVVLRMPYEDERASRFIAERIGVPMRVIPGTVGGMAGTDTLIGLFDVILAQLQVPAP